MLAIKLYANLICIFPLFKANSKGKHELQFSLFKREDHKCYVSKYIIMVALNKKMQILWVNI